MPRPETADSGSKTSRSATDFTGHKLDCEEAAKERYSRIQSDVSAYLEDEVHFCFQYFAAEIFKCLTISW